MFSSDTSSSSLSLTSTLGKRVIVALAILQALLLLFFHEGIAREWRVFENITVRVIYLTLTVGVPTTLYLLVDDPRRRRPWLYTLGVAVVLFVLAWYAGSQCAPQRGLETDSVLWPYGLSLTAGWFISLAFLQVARLGQPYKYEVLFEAGWHHVLSLVLATLFTIAFWLFLALWALLFDIIGISFFKDIFTDRRFVYAATGLVGGIGVVLVRSYAVAIATVRGLLLSLAGALLPLGGVITLIFLAALPFTGLQPLWDTNRAAALMMALTGLMIFFLNGVFQTGRTQTNDSLGDADTQPYPFMVHRFLEAAFVALPIYVALSTYALALRVGQYGWTLSRVWAALLILVLGAYALSYAVAVFKPRAGWMRLLRPANVYIALGLVALLVLVNTPLLAPLRFAASSQANRLRYADLTPLQTRRLLRYLRFETGKEGLATIKRFRSQHVFSDRSQLSSWLEETLSHDGRVPFERRNQQAPFSLRDSITVVPDSSVAMSERLLSAIKQHATARSCTPANCVLLDVNVYDGPQPERVFVTNHHAYLEASVFVRQDTVWRRVRRMNSPYAAPGDSIMQALRKGNFATHTSPWRDLSIGGVQLEKR